MIDSIIYNDKLHVFKVNQLSEKRRCLSAFFNECSKTNIDYCVEEYSNNLLISKSFYSNHKLHNESGPAAIEKYLIHKDLNMYYINGKWIGSDLNIFDKEQLQNYLLF